MFASKRSMFDNLSFTIKSKLGYQYKDFVKKWQVDRSIFLDNARSYAHIDEKVNVILSPKFYWVRKEALPVKKVSQAYKIVESFFSDILPEGEYKYKIIKHDGYFLLFAYQDRLIIEAIRESALDISLVNRLFFIQNELTGVEGIVDINGDDWLYEQDDIWVKLPRHLLELPAVDEIANHQEPFHQEPQPLNNEESSDR